MIRTTSINSTGISRRHDEKKEYIEKLYTKLHEAMEKPVTLGSAEEVGLYSKTICRIENLHGHNY